MNIFKKWGVAKEKRIAKRVKDEQYWLSTCVKESELAAKEMFIKPCPINGDKCFQDCVHFNDGGVEYKYYGTDRIPVTIYPKCKLWK